MQIAKNGRIIDYQPYQDRLYKIKMIMRLKENRTFRNVFKYDLTERLLGDLKDVSNPNHQFVTNTVINLSGLSGTGKSACIMTIGLQCFPHFNHKNMFFFDQQILDNVSLFPQNTLIVRDENPQKAVFGQGSSRTSAQFTVMSETCRKAGLNLALVEPSFAQDPISKILLETIDMDITTRITRLALRDTYTLNYMGGIYLPIIQEDNKEWILYNKNKDKFIEAVKRGDLADAKTDYNEMAKRMFAHPDFHEYKTKKERRALANIIFPTLTGGEVDTICTIVEVQLRKQ